MFSEHGSCVLPVTVTSGGEGCIGSQGPHFAFFERSNARMAVHDIESLIVMKEGPLLKPTWLK